MTAPIPIVRALWRPEQFTRCTNGTFEVSTTGWAVTAGVNAAAGTSITRITTDSYAGSACAQVVTTATLNSGCHFDLAADRYYLESQYGTVYAALVYLRRTSGSYRARLVLGSEGTVADRATLDITLTDTWQPYRVLWLPSGNRTDAQLAITNGTTQILTFKVDGVSIYQIDAFSQIENSNFRADTTGWGVGATGQTVAATSITRLTTDGMDPTLLRCAELVTTASVSSGGSYPLGIRKFTNGRTYRVLMAAKRASGGTSVQLVLGSGGTPGDVGGTSITLTTGWVLYSANWTPTADRTDAIVALRNLAAAVVTVRIGFVEVYEALDELTGSANDLASMRWGRGDNFASSSSAPGTIALTVRDVDTSHKYTPWNTAGTLYGSLEPGRKVWGRATLSGAIYPLFYGTIRQIVPDPYAAQTVIMAEDPLYDMSRTSVSVGFSAPPVVNWLPSEMNRLAMSCVWP